MLYKEEKEIKYFIFWEEIKSPLHLNRNNLILEIQVLLQVKLTQENLILRHSSLQAMV